MFATHLSLALALALPAQAPADAPLSLPQVLAHLGEEAMRLKRSLPSFTCQQSVVSQELKKRKVVRSVAFTATVSARRRDDGSLDESFVPITVDGKPFSGGFTMPTYVTGGFSRTLVYFLPDQQPCYRYTLSAGRIDFTTANPLPDGAGCRSQGMSGFALLDAHGDVVHLERRVTPQFSRRFQFTEFAALDFAPVAFNGTAYLLANRLVAEDGRGSSVARFDATYSGCKLFTATVTLGPANETPPDPAPK